MKTIRTQAGNRKGEPLRAIVAAFLGLGYILVLPLFGLFTLISLTVSRLKQEFLAHRHRTAHFPYDTW